MYARQTLRALAAHSGIPKTTIVQHMKDEKQLQARSSCVRPRLTDANTAAQMKHVMNFLQPTSNGNQIFADMNSYISCPLKVVLFDAGEEEVLCLHGYPNQPGQVEAVHYQSHVFGGGGSTPLRLSQQGDVRQQDRYMTPSGAPTCAAQQQEQSKWDYAYRPSKRHGGRLPLDDLGQGRTCNPSKDAKAWSDRHDHVVL
ncbi:hypothetical protein AaE_007702 [Aphanomyces astaci]|uniref:Uncharacterized protein n=1 Tax=Aphanomyces astaci TaxID=112090 RepID=A0A6A5AA36_APHAT|nr:hypothetical protein AaE_007702 [Aphanomyces astaci]